MVPLLAMIADGPFEAALVSEAKRFLATIEVAGPYTVDYAGPVVNSDGTSTLTSCRLKAADGLHYQGYLWNATGRLCSLVSERKHEGGSETRKAASQSPEAQRSRAKALMARIGSPYPVLAVEDEYAPFAWESTEDRLTFPIAIRGHRFIYPSLGYGLTLDAKTGEFHKFTASDSPPAVGDPIARLTRADAVRVAERSLVGDPPQPYVNRRMKPWTDYTVDPGSIYPFERTRDLIRLGWFAPKGETVARLAWKVPYWINHHSAGGTKGSLLAFMVDAITGEPLPADGLSGTL